MDYIKLLEHGMKPCQHMCWTMDFKEENLIRPCSSKGTKMSSMGELTFFLGLQVKQKNDGIFICQDKYVGEILKKFGFTEVKNASTPIETQKPLLKDEDVCACARYQVNPKVSHLHDVKMIFRYLKGHPKLGLWYPKDYSFDLVAYIDSDYARASLDRKSTTGCCQYLRSRLISWQCKKQTVVVNSTTEAEYVTASSCCGQVLWIQNQLLDYGYNFMHTKAKTINGEAQIHAWVDDKEIIITESFVRRDLRLVYEEGIDCLPNSTIFENLELMGCQDTLGDTIAQTRFENVSKISNDSVQARGVLDLEKTKTTQALEITSLKRWVKKLEKKQRSRTHKLKDYTSVAGEVNAASIATTVSATATITTEKITLAQALMEIKTSKPKAKEIVLQEPTNIALIETSDDVQAKIDANYQLAERLQAEEQQELTDEEKSSLFVQLLEKRRKFFVVKRAEEKRNKLPTQAQKRKIMCTYLKNMEGYTPKQLKSFEFDKIQEMFDKAFKRVNTFEDFRTELVQRQDKEKRAGEELT
nr:hypothetical protein [Tanacetum cinerariifolium]